MQLPFELKIALRYIRSPRKAAVSLITMITIGGVMLGVAALTVVTSVWNGFEAEFLEKLLGINAHAVVLRNHDVFRNHRSVAEGLAKAPGVVAVAPFVYSEVIVQSDANVQGVAIKGLDPAVSRSTPLGKYVPPEAFDALATLQARVEEGGEGRRLPGVILGSDLAEALHTSKGKSITIISPYGGQGGDPRTQVFDVVGTFHSGMYEFDARMVFIDLTEAQRFFRLYETVTGLEVWTQDPLTSYDVVNEAAQRLDPEDRFAYEVRDWSRTNRGLFGAVQSQKALITIVLAFIVLVAAFNILATLILLILEKSREIAILKSLGASDRSILAIFVVDGQIVGIVGCALGILLGLTICGVLQEYGLKLDPRVYYLEHLPVVVRPIEVALVAFGAMTAATLATLWPARKAARLPPVEGLTQRDSIKRPAKPAPAT
ncbi:ABC transporter permease [Myxococcota bacterium]|nr:ABC transporter permease [Myxococcota bacterium]